MEEIDKLMNCKNPVFHECIALPSFYYCSYKIQKSFGFPFSFFSFPNFKVLSGAPCGMHLIYFDRWFPVLQAQVLYFSSFLLSTKLQLQIDFML